MPTKIAALKPGALPAATTRKCEDLLIDVVGLCVTARNEDYVRSALAGCDDDGPCTAIGHARTLTAAGAAFVNGTAAHGEDFDDTFEGGPVHAGAVIVPAVLAACERHNPDGRMALIGIAVGTEVLCRLSLVVPKAVHKAGFHPTAVFGAMGAAAGVGAALGLNARQIVDALGIAGSMAGGIIEYLAEGAWTKRLHAGWAAQSGIRAALLARGGFVGPRTVFEGVHGLFHGFAHTTKGDYDALTGDFGTRWVTDTLAFKPYPCGTMAQPYIDCARRLAARGIKAEDIAEIVCEVAEGTVHRLWEPLADKQRPRNGYAAKFAVPYLLAAGFVHGGVGLGAFTESAIRDPRVLALAAKVKFVIDPGQSLSEQLHRPYPRDAEGRQRDRGAAASSARRRAGAVDAAGCDRQVRAQRAAWRLEQGAERAALEADGRACIDGQRSICRRCVDRACMTKELTGKVAIVTGAGRNIGRAIALALAEGGASIVVNARSNRAEAEAVAREIEASGGKAIGPYRRRRRRQGGAGDGGRGRASNSAASTSSSTTPRCGGKSRSPRWTIAEWREILDVTLDGAFHCVKACLPALRKSGAGTIVNIGGLSAHTGAKNRAHVVTAKAGIIGFTRALAHDLADDGITVNCVVPGPDRHAAAEGQAGTGASSDPSDHHRRAGPAGGRRGHGALPLRPGRALHQRAGDPRQWRGLSRRVMHGMAAVFAGACRIKPLGMAGI